MNHIECAEAMVEKFQCPGCVVGGDTKCGQFELNTVYGFSCRSHVLGTYMGGVGHMAIGLPKGFDRSPPDKSHPGGTANRMEIRLWVKGAALPRWDHLNVPVWAMEKDGYLFVRTVAPRRARMSVDVIEGGTLALVPTAIDASKFIDDID